MHSVAFFVQLIKIREPQGNLCVKIRYQNKKVKLVIPNLGNTTSGSGKTAQKNRKSQEIFDEFISLYIDKLSLAVK